MSFQNSGNFHFNFLRGRCKSNGITSRMPSSALHRVAIKMYHIVSVTRICLRIEVCYIIHFILTAFTGKAGFPPHSQSSPEETAGRVSVTVNSKFNLCLVTKHRKWEIRVGNVIFFCALPRRRFGICHKNQQKHVLIVFA